MTTTRTSRPRRIAHRIHNTWAELDHAQRRLLEIRTGVSGLTRPADRTRANHDEL
jgi:hypothetical protein